MLLRVKAVIALVIFMYFNVTTAKNCEHIKRFCRESSKRQCYFDMLRTCFKHFQSNCEMEYAMCSNNKIYKPWSEKFCESLQFMCPEEIDDYNWPPDYFYDQIVHLRDNKKNDFEGMF